VTGIQRRSVVEEVPWRIVKWSGSQRQIEFDVHRFVNGEGSGALQDGAEGVDLSGRPTGEVGEGAVADFAVETEGFAEEDGGG
jgi:hypothetical protein